MDAISFLSVEVSFLFSSRKYSHIMQILKTHLNYNDRKCGMAGFSARSRRPLSKWV